MSGLASGLYRFRLRATDAEGASASDTVTVSVLPAESDPADFVAQFTTRGDGTLSGNALQPVPPGGDTTAVEAIPAAGSYFVQWTGDASSEESRLTLEGVNGDLHLEARFVTIPDTWFTDHGLTPSGDATRSDEDGDGQSAWEEFLFGTDPGTRAISSPTQSARIQEAGPLRSPALPPPVAPTPRNTATTCSPTTGPTTRPSPAMAANWSFPVPI